MPKKVRLPRGALRQLKQADPLLAALIRKVGPFAMETGKAESPLASLLQAIVFQQLSGKAAATIYGRFRALFPVEDFPEPTKILAASEEALRGIGFSRQKVEYVRALCEAVASGSLSFSQFASMSDEEVIAALTQVRGIGRWSAEMFLMFQLGRLDVWPLDDLVIRKAIGLLHGHEEVPRKPLMQETGELYRPYRTVVCWYLWKHFDENADDW